MAKAYWKKKNREMDVAVKSIPTGHNDSEDRVKLLQEAVMMGQFRHPNVVQLHGIVTAGTSVSLRRHTCSGATVSLRCHMLQWLSLLFVFVTSICFLPRCNRETSYLLARAIQPHVRR